MSLRDDVTASFDTLANGARRAASRDIQTLTLTRSDAQFRID